MGLDMVIIISILVILSFPIWVTLLGILFGFVITGIVVPVCILMEFIKHIWSVVIKRV